ncbi:MAG: hypothetical protein ACOXZK_01490 [Bacteroidales bacterium]|jgi:hypothetical protein|nr:hypothetical protein [Bacteroidales bacterium]
MKSFFILILVLVVFSAKSQSTSDVESSSKSKNTSISLFTGFSFVRNNQFKQSLEDNGLLVDIPPVNALMGLKANTINLYNYGILSVEIGAEGSSQAKNNSYTALRNINGVVEILFPILNEEKIKVFPTFGVEYAYSTFEYYQLDDATISFQDLLTTNYGGINLNRDYTFYALFGVSLNYFFRENLGVSVFSRYRIPLDKNNAHWRVANTKSEVTNLDNYISNYISSGAGIVFPF